MSENKKITMEVLGLFPEIDKILNRTEINIDEKSGIGNIVTRTDKIIESYLKNSITTIFPNSQVIAEESSDLLTEEKDLKFIIDPLDGTTNYTNSWPHSVAIGCIKNNELISGIVYDVLNKTIYVGIINEGVVKYSINSIEVQEKIISPLYLDEDIKKSVICYDTPYGKDAFDLTQRMCYELYSSGASLKTVGPISLDVLKTALGKENRPHDYNMATWHMEVRAWDLAASTCILRELGGEIIGKDGVPLSLDILSSPSAMISFIACGNSNLRLKIFEKLEQSIVQK